VFSLIYFLFIDKQTQKKLKNIFYKKRALNFLYCLVLMHVFNLLGIPYGD